MPENDTPDFMEHSRTTGDSFAEATFSRPSMSLPTAGEAQTNGQDDFDDENCLPEYMIPFQYVADNDYLAPSIEPEPWSAQSLRFPELVIPSGGSDIPSPGANPYLAAYPFDAPEVFDHSNGMPSANGHDGYAHSYQITDDIDMDRQRPRTLQCVSRLEFRPTNRLAPEDWDSSQMPAPLSAAFW